MKSKVIFILLIFLLCAKGLEIFVLYNNNKFITFLVNEENTENEDSKSEFKDFLLNEYFINPIKLKYNLIINIIRFFISYKLLYINPYINIFLRPPLY